MEFDQPVEPDIAEDSILCHILYYFQGDVYGLSDGILEIWSSKS